MILPVKGDPRLKIVSQPMALLKWFSIPGVFSMLHCCHWASEPPTRDFISRSDISFCKWDSQLDVRMYQANHLALSDWRLPDIDFIQLSGLWSLIRLIMNKYLQWRNKQIIFNWSQTDLKLNEIPHSYVGFNCGSTKYQTDNWMLGRF